MSIFGALLRGSIENPDTPLSSSTIGDWLGGGRTKAGVTVNERRVLGLPTFWTGVRLVSSSLAQVPIHTYRKGSRQRVDRAVWAPALEKPNPAQTPFEFWQTFYMHAQCWNNAFAFKERNRAGVVVELWLVHPSRVEVIADSRVTNPTRKAFRITFDDGSQAIYTPDDIFHVPYMSVDGREGVRPLEVLRETYGTAIAVDDSAARFYGHGTQVSGILTTEQSLSDPEAKALKKRWQERVAGPVNAHEIAVLDKGAKFERVGISPADAQLLESRKWEVSEIARVIGLPPHLVGDVEKSTSWGTGIEQQNIGVVVYLFSGWVTAVEQRISTDLVAGGARGATYAKGALQGFLRGDAKTRSAFYQRAIADGWMSRNEVRELEELEPVDGLDEFLVPSNLTLISVDGEIIPLSAKGVADAEQSA